MVIALIFHIAVMIVERSLYLSRTSQALKLAIARISNPNVNDPSIKWDRPLQMKLLLHIILIATVDFVVFWYFPINSSEITTGKNYCEDKFDRNKCNNFQINPSLQIFYLLYMIYFIIVSLQIRYGLPSFRSGTFPLMRSTSRYSKMLFQIYRGIPFLFEIRTLVDWVFTPTALDISQWIKFENLYAQLYINKCNSMNYQQRVRGSPIGSVQRLGMGCCLLVVILGIILAPLILFSSLNPIVESNKVKSMSVQIGITVDQSYYNLYSASRVSDIHDITDSEWNKLNFNSVNGVDITDKDITQVVTMPTASDSLWNIAPPSYLQLCATLNSSIDDSKDSVVLFMSHSYIRDFPTSFPKLSQDFTYSLVREEILNLYQTICLSESIEFYFSNFPLILIWLPSSGENMLPDTIIDDKIKNKITMKKLNDTHGYYFWEVGLTNEIQNLQGLRFFTISEKYSPMTFSFSIITFYISVVGLLGRLLRYTLAGPVNFIMTEMPDPEPIINMCNGIYLSRMTGDLLREEELYYELIDIVRSPEMLKLITGRSSIKEKVE